MKNLLAKTIQVMIDETGNEISVGRSEYDSPEIDNIVHVRSSQETGSIKDVVMSK